MAPHASRADNDLHSAPMVGVVKADADGIRALNIRHDRERTTRVRADK